MAQAESDNVFTLDFSLTLRDWIAILFHRHRPLYLWIRRGVVLILTGCTLWHFAIAPLAFPLRLCVLAFVVYVVPTVLFRSMMICVLSKLAPHVHVVLDQTGIALSGRGKTQHVAWSSIAFCGGAVEYNDLIYMDSGTCPCWIPKRVFRERHELEQFRRFVANQLGGRYKIVGGERGTSRASTQLPT